MADDDLVMQKAAREIARLTDFTYEEALRQLRAYNNAAPEPAREECPNFIRLGDRVLHCVGDAGTVHDCYYGRAVQPSAPAQGAEDIALPGPIDMRDGFGIAGFAQYPQRSAADAATREGADDTEGANPVPASVGTSAAAAPVAKKATPADATESRGLPDRCSGQAGVAPAPDTRAGDGQSHAWKSGNEFAPYHRSASHVPPDYRDGWNACYSEAAARIVALAEERDEVYKRMDDQLHDYQEELRPLYVERDALAEERDTWREKAHKWADRGDETVAGWIAAREEMKVRAEKAEAVIVALAEERDTAEGYTRIAYADADQWRGKVEQARGDAASSSQATEIYREREQSALIAADNLRKDLRAARAALAEARECIGFADMVRQATHPGPASWAHYDKKRAALDAATGPGAT